MPTDGGYGDHSEQREFSRCRYEVHVEPCESSERELHLGWLGKRDDKKRWDQVIEALERNVMALQQEDLGDMSLLHDNMLDWAVWGRLKWKDSEGKEKEGMCFDTKLVAAVTSGLANRHRWQRQEYMEGSWAPKRAVVTENHEIEGLRIHKEQSRLPTLLSEKSKRNAINGREPGLLKCSRSISPMHTRSALVLGSITNHRQPLPERRYKNSSRLLMRLWCTNIRCSR